MRINRSQNVDTHRSLGTALGSGPVSPSVREGARNAMGTGRHAAAYAGLAGSLALLVPSRASALTLSDVTLALDTAFSSPSIAFFVGLAWGAAASAAVCTVVTLVSLKVEDHAAEQQVEEPAADMPLVEVDMRKMDEPQEDVSAWSGRPVGSHFAPGTTLGQEPEAELSARRQEERDREPSASQTQPSRHAALDYEEIAENYVRRLSFREKMARRAKGVAANLMERLGSDKMDGVPVITRADGSVGDVGTSWWEASVGAEAISPTSGFAPEDDIAIPSDFGSRAPQAGAAPAARRQPGGRSVAERLGSLGTFEQSPVPGGAVSHVPAGDTTARMGFSDMVGGSDSLDEPDNLEPQTAFIPFRPVAGHPEITDTESYVNHILEEELSRCASSSVRNNSKRYLRMIEGGRYSSVRRPEAFDTGGGYVGKHFASSQAYEA